MGDLKPCPFCGDDDIDFYGVRDGLQLVCKKCHVSFVRYNGPPNNTAQDRLITAWNTRATPKVKPLEWKDAEAVELAKQSAYTPVGYYYAGDCLFWGPGTIVSTGYQNIDQAKAAAQADYERRILSALEETQ